MPSMNNKDLMTLTSTYKSVYKCLDICNSANKNSISPE